MKGTAKERGLGICIGLAGSEQKLNQGSQMVTLYLQTESIQLTVLKFRVIINTLTINSQTGVSASRNLVCNSIAEKNSVGTRPTGCVPLSRLINFSGLQWSCPHNDKVELEVRFLKPFQQVFIEHLLPA